MPDDPIIMSEDSLVSMVADLMRKGAELALRAAGYEESDEAPGLWWLSNVPSTPHAISLHDLVKGDPDA